MDYQKLRSKFCFWPDGNAFRPVKKFHELRNFTNTNRKVCPKCSFFNLMNRQTRVKRKVAFFIEYSRTKKVEILLSPTFPPYYLLSPFFKPFVTHPPKLNELNNVVTPPPPSPLKKRELESAQDLVIDKQDSVKDKLFHFTDGEFLFVKILCLL